MNDMAIIDTMHAVASARIGSVSVQGVRLFKDITKERLQSLLNFWKQNDYLLIQDALTDDAISLLKEHVTYEQMNSVHDSRQFFRVHNDKECDAFIGEVLNASNLYYATILSADILPAYAFAMKYIKNSDMDPHYDSYNNPISSTICYHFSPEHLSNPIYVDRAVFSNPYTHRLTIKDRNGIPVESVAEIHMRAGDIAVFRGRNHLHWRKPVLVDMDYRAILVHFCDNKYKGSILPAGVMPYIEHRLIDLESYDDFRRTYAMYFDTAGKSWT